jgi:hypothetical protein
MRKSHVRLRFLVACVLTWHASAHAASNDIKLGDIPRYPDEAVARAACGDDPVIWADRHSGFFYPKFHSDYGKTKQGAYACYSQAK